MTTGTQATEWRRILVPPFILLAFVAGAAFAWYSAHSLLMLFAGILFAVFLDACTRGLGYILPLSRTWRFGLVALMLASLAALAIVWGIIRMPAQARMLLQVMDTQLTILENYLATFGIDLFGPGGRHDLSQFIADPGRLFGHVQYAVSGAYVFGITTIVIVCLGLFFAGQPAAYREGVLVLVPQDARPRMREVMNEMGQTLRSWLLGQLVRSTIVAVVLAVTLHSLGVPGAGLLGVQAGVANFIPYLGPLIAALPVALVTMPLGLPALAWVWRSTSSYRQSRASWSLRWSRRDRSMWRRPGPCSPSCCSARCSAPWASRWQPPCSRSAASPPCASTSRTG